VIERRIRAAAEGDFVVAFYNPRSQDRDWQLGAALEILARHRDPETPVGVVHDAFRPGQQVLVTTLAGVDPAVADMRSVVIVGSASTRVIAGRMVTPRGYKWQRR
jgi:cobalt-precorrin 5A hydrolase/precorrin-3B C17-methyltransferase